MTATAPKRGRGRPRNTALDSLAEELAVSRRRASTILRDQKISGKEVSEKSTGLSPLAEARLQKTLREIAFLETRIRAAELEERELEGELIFKADAIELFNQTLLPIRNSLENFAKQLAPRLVGQPQKSIEATLRAEADRIIALGRAGATRFEFRRQS
jgi:hypothetical protein